jgi:hypothetical protein
MSEPKATSGAEMALRIFAVAAILVSLTVPWNFLLWGWCELLLDALFGNSASTSRDLVLYVMVLVVSVALFAVLFWSMNYVSRSIRQRLRTKLLIAVTGFYLLFWITLMGLLL